MLTQNLKSMVSSSAAQVIGMKKRVPPKAGEVTISANKDVTLEVDIGTNDFTVLIDCDSVQTAVLSPPPGRLAVKNGKLVAWKRVDAGTAAID